MSVKLGVNLDHIATVRQARGTVYPDIVQATEAAIAGGANGITLHLREDRRHIQDADVLAVHDFLVSHNSSTPQPITLNLEMAATDEMLAFASILKPNYCCLVPEKREELTTEGGLNVIDHVPMLTDYCAQLTQHGIQTSIFIDPEIVAIDAAVAIGVPIVELHTGEYANHTDIGAQDKEFNRISEAAAYAQSRGLIVNAGHGLTLANVGPIASIAGINELNIGHSLIADSLFVGLRQSVMNMKQKLRRELP